MQRMILLGAMALACFGWNAPAHATIDWAGNAFPNHGTVVLPTADIDVYAQVFKSGVTDPEGQGADISAILQYQTDAMGAPADVVMGFQGDVGNNDEYTAAVPQAALVGANYVDVTVIFTDETDASTFEITGDQNGNPPLLRYDITDALPNDVDVTFTMCLSGEETAGDVAVTGSADELTIWGDGVVMSTPDGQLFQVTVTFLAGSSPGVEYKYRKDGGATWENIGNRAIVLPTDGTTVVALDMDSWDNLPLGCGGETLLEDKVICFSLCLEGVEYTEDVCVTGGHELLTNWGDGVVLESTGSDLYEKCIRFPAGIPVPGAVEYKFKKDGCQTWEEGIPNRVVVIDNDTPNGVKVEHTWEDGPGDCNPVGVESSSWGEVKSNYR